MIIDEIVLHNFGVYKGRQTISLTPPSKDKPIVLFGGQNGGGKTTFLDALQLGLYGKYARCSNRGSLSYEEFIRRSIHKAINPREGAALELQFRHISNGKEHTYRINRLWVQNGKDIKENTEVLQDGKLDRVLTEGWSEYVEEYIPSRISHLFFFDSEKIEGFADLENSAQLLSTAIHSLLGLDIVDQLSNDLVVLERRKRTSTKSDAERKQIEQAMAEIKELENRRSELHQTRANVNTELGQQEKKLHELEERFRRDGGKLFESREEIETQRATVEQNLRSLEEDLRDIASGPAPLLLVTSLLKSIDKQCGLEESAFQAKGLNAVLTKRDNQLLDLAHSSNVPKKTLKTLKEFLSEDRNRRINESKIETYLCLDNGTRRSIQNLIETLSKEVQNRSAKLLKKVDELKEVLDDLDRKLVSIPDQDQLTQIIERREKVRLEKERSQFRIKVLDEELERLKREREQKQNWMVSQIEKAVENDFEKEDVTRIIQHSQKVRESLKVFRTSIIIYHVDRICRLILDCFNQLIRKSNLLKELKIDPANFTLELRGGDLEVLPSDRLSAGERQLLAISLLWGLARASGRPLPTAIDTPLGRLDSSHRTHLVERYFPYASHQVLLFSTDEEIDKRYFEKLKPYIGRTYLLDFDDVSSSTQIRPGYYW